MSSKSPKHILKLSTEEKRDFLESFDYVFSDLDGVLWNLWDKIEGASDGYKALESVGKTVTFVTNNSVRPDKVLEKKFQNANIEVNLKTVWHPSKNIIKYLKEIDFKGLIYVIGSTRFKKTLNDAGFEVIDGPNEIIEESVTVLNGHVFDKKPVRAVIIDIDFNLSSVKLMRAQMYLRNSECLFIAGATDLVLPVHPDGNVLGPGVFLNILKDFTNNELIILGKPGAALAELIKKEFKLENPKRAIMIGDMLEQDIGFGSECGFQTLLVLSGACKLQDLSAERNPKYIPDFYANSMRDFVEFIADVKKSHV